MSQHLTLPLASAVVSSSLDPDRPPAVLICAELATDFRLVLRARSAADIEAFIFAVRSASEKAFPIADKSPELR